MPKLLLFAPCQKSIIDKTENSVSLISIMHGLVINIEGTLLPEIFPEDTRVPLTWAVTTLWLRSVGEEEKTFEQKIEIISPTGGNVEINIQPFQMTQRTHHVSITINNFPLVSPGEYILVLSLREIGAENDWEKIAEYPVELKYNKNMITQPEKTDD